MYKNSYEVSLWADEHEAAAITSSAFYTSAGEGFLTSTGEELQTLNSGYFGEVKLAIIGSDTMTAGYRTFDNKLTKKINGEVEFTFSIFYKYIDPTDGVEKSNPFLDYLVNERKIKVKWNNEWYDFVIKDCLESTDGSRIEYTCLDIFVNELSKTGFEFEFDTELENNTGTVTELAEAVLKNTDWAVLDSSDLILQYQDEAVYETVAEVTGTSGVSFVAYSDLDLSESVDVVDGAKLLVYWNTFKNKETFFLFALYLDNQTWSSGTITPPLLTNSMIVDKDYVKCLFVPNVSWADDGTYIYVRVNGNTICKFLVNANVSTQYRAERLVRTQLLQIDTYHDLNVLIYTTSPALANDELIYKHTRTTYYDATFIQNLVANPDTFTTTEGWSGLTFSKWLLTLPYEEGETPTYISTLRIEPTYGTSATPSIIYNNGLSNSTNYIDDGFAVGDIYKLRIEGAFNTGDLTTYEAPHIIDADHAASSLRLRICDYTYNSSTNAYTLVAGSDYFSSSTATDIFNANPKSSGWYLEKSTVSPATEGWYEKIALTTDSYLLSTDTSIISSKEYYSRSNLTYTLIDTTASYLRTNLRECRSATNYYKYDSSTGTYTLITNAEKRPGVEFTFTCTKSVTLEDIKTFGKCGLFIDLTEITGTRPTIYLKDMLFFKYAIDSENKQINPGDYGAIATIMTEYSYYSSLDLDDEITYYYRGNTDVNSLTINGTTYTLIPSYNNNFEKIRSISEKESNRFNLLQTLAETFECWMQIVVEHNDDGTIKRESASPESEDRLPYQLRKFIKFVLDVGTETGITFVYGLDLKTITRTIESTLIVTKTIVSANDNEYGEDGFCSIARSSENYPKLNYILNFDYFISKGLLDGTLLMKDLYYTTSLGFYVLMHNYNEEYDTNTELLTNAKTTLTKQESQYTVTSNYLSTTDTELTELKSEILALAGYTSVSDFDAALAKCADSTATDAMQAKAADYKRLQIKLDELTIAEADLKNAINTSKEYIADLTTTSKTLILNIEDLELTFYTKYSRFIQEGSWLSDDYYDDDEYYLDAVKTAYESSRPTVEYDIEVMRLNSLEEFKNKKFNLGDIGYILDTDFFGYTIVNNLKTPYKEKILISEVCYNFDSPNLDTITVQNYRTQFEDLFQRITATTQSLEYSSGSYERAASAITTTGAISSEVLSNSFLFNKDLVISASNQLVLYDDTGITLQSASNINSIVRITSEGIALSNNGGSTWSTGINGSGISTSCLTAGRIDVLNIFVYNGTIPAFRWDGTGINAYKWSSSNGVDLSKFVRFDLYGLYGINGTEAFDPDEPENSVSGEDKIWAHAQFALTWKGFSLKTTNGSVVITSTDDFLVLETVDNVSVLRIKIGCLSNNNYGIVINDKTGTPVLTTHSDGSLWLDLILSISDISSLGHLNQYDYLSVSSPDDNPQEAGYYECYNDVYDVTQDTEDMGKEYYARSSYSGTTPKADVAYEAYVQNGTTLFYYATTDATSVAGKTYYLFNTTSFAVGVYELYTARYVLTSDTSVISGKTYYTINEQIFNSNDNFIVYDNGHLVANSLKITGDMLAGETILGLKLEGNTILSSGQIKGSTITTSDISIYGGGITIYKESEGTASPTKLFYVDNDTDLLYMNGSGNFTNATFEGTITSTNGTIGGFYITNTGIISSDNSVQLLCATTSSGSKIVANTIELGTGASISDYLLLGNAKIYNPDEHSGSFIETSSFALDLNGNISIANGLIKITTTNNNPVITGINDGQISFSISPDWSYFNNVKISGILDTAVFNIGSTQTAGGLMIFRPSAKVASQQNSYTAVSTPAGNPQELGWYELVSGTYILTVDTTVDNTKTYYIGKTILTLEEAVQDNDFVVNTLVALLASSDNLNFSLIIGKNTDNLNLTIDKILATSIILVVDIGIVESNAYKNNMIIGINSGEAPGFNGMIPGNTITFIKYDGTLSAKPNLVLGELDNIFDNTAISGYGLYSDNVFLNGVLATKLADDESANLYTGINTLNGATATVFGTEDNSAIVFWGGATSLDTTDILAAPFLVTLNGSLYAQRGKFSGSVITDAYIEASSLYAAKIYGGTSEDTGADSLKLYQLNNGIEFFNTRSSTSPALLLTSTDFKYGETENESDKKAFINFSTTNNISEVSANFDLYTVNDQYCFSVDNSVLSLSSGDDYSDTLVNCSSSKIELVTNLLLVNEFYSLKSRLETSYTSITSPTGNPYEQGWYEKSDDTYVLTNDTSVISGKTYYIATLATYGYDLYIL